MAAWSLVTYVIDDGEDRAGVQLADGSVRQPDVLRPYAGLRPALDDWSQVSDGLRGLDTAALPVVERARVVAPIRFPNKLLASGANYRDHMRNMGTPELPEGAEPYLYMVPATTTMIGPGETIEIPADPAANADWEVELAVVIGTAGRDIPVERALGHVAGYACLNDISARGYHRRKVALAEPFLWDYISGKGLDTFKPMGPVTPAWLVDDPQGVSIRSTVNGVLKQDGNTRDMIWSIAELIAAASKGRTLEPGDVIATGTCAGAGAERGEFLKDGDEILLEIDGLAPLRNPVKVRS